MLRLTAVLVFVWMAVQGTAQKTVTAVKTSGVPVIDGSLDDAVWQNAPVITDFVQNFPTFGIPASIKTEVRILYDNNAIYIGAILFDDPAQVRRQLTARDGEQRQDVDYFSVFFDTYNDQQNGFQFLVTAANVQTDAKMDPSSSYRFGDFGDRSWDAVWQSSTRFHDQGWSVEMRIPYISLRFPSHEMQTWGIQFLRFTRRNNESSFWNPVDPNINGFINQFGKYGPLEDLRPPLRLSFSPYISGGVRFNPTGSLRETEFLRNGGMDVKYGINESFTLDITLIPDFGQVVSDNVINNLSPFEIRFQENRPFFTEGIELFNKAGLFYSRRVGDIPMFHDSVTRFASDNPRYRVERNPSVVQLYNATKFSGRTPKKLGIGIFNAITAPMDARLHDLDLKMDTVIRTEPLTNYNIIVLDQAIRGRSSVTFTNTNVYRRGEARDANVSALDWSLFSSGSIYRLNGSVHYSRIFGYTPYNGSLNLAEDTITRDGRLFVRPYDGFNSLLRFGKVSGPLQFSASANIQSHTYDPNDLGFIANANKVQYNGSVSYNEFTPGSIFLNYRHSINTQYNRLYRPNAFNMFEMWYSGFLFFRNFWDITVNIGGQPRWQHDYFELRTPGHILKKPSFYYISANGSTDSRKRLFMSFQAGYTRSDIEHGRYFITAGGARYRFSNRFTMSLDMTRQKDNNQVGFAFFRETDGQPVAGYRKFTEVVSVLSGIYNFTPRMNLTLRARHYWNRVSYRGFFNVDSEGNHIPRTLPAPDRDANVNLFNLDAFLTWDFRLGSRMILGWKNWLADPFGSPIAAHATYFRNLDRMLSLPHGNEISFKFIYFIDYNQLFGK